MAVNVDFKLYQGFLSMLQRWKDEDLRPIIDEAEFSTIQEPLAVTFPVTTEQSPFLPPTNYSVSQPI